MHETKHDFGKKDMGRQILDYVKVSEGGRSEIQYPASQYIPCTIYKPIYIYIYILYNPFPLLSNTSGTRHIWDHRMGGVWYRDGIMVVQADVPPGQVDLDSHFWIPTGHRPLPDFRSLHPQIGMMWYIIIYIYDMDHPRYGWYDDWITYGSPMTRLTWRRFRSPCPKTRAAAASSARSCCSGWRHSWPSCHGNGGSRRPRCRCGSLGHASGCWRACWPWSMGSRPSSTQHLGWLGRWAVGDVGVKSWCQWIDVDSSW